MAASRARTAPPPPATRKESRPPTKPARRAAPKKTTAPALAPEPTPQITEAQIAERAYYLWLRKGRPVGQDAQNWAEAEQELKKLAGL